MNRCAHCYGDLPEFAVFCPHCARADEPDFTQLINQTIGDRYRIYRRLGQGGLSTVFAATDLQTDNVVVVKVSDPAQLVQRELSYAIDADSARNYWGEMLERMRREAETLAEIDHPNIVRFYDTGLIGEDLRFVVMEFLRGRMLREEMNAKGKLEPSDAIRITLEICEALREVHARDIVHRDISPRNIFIAESGETNQSAIKLIDFGIAKFPQPPGAPPFTQHSILSGTVAYASPEQCQSREVDHRSDIYSLGVVLYEMVTGQRPFVGRTPTEIALKQIQAEPVPPGQLNPGLAASLERVILRALAKDPDERQQSAEVLAEELRTSERQVFISLQPFQSLEAAAIGGGQDVEEEGGNTIDRAQLVRRRRRRVALAAAALVLVAAATGILFGKNWLVSRFPELSQLGSSPANILPSPSPSDSPGPSTSDPDSLELAAQLPADNVAVAAGNRSAQSSSAANSTKLPDAKPTASVNPNAVAKAPAKPTPAPPPSPKQAAAAATPPAVAKAQPGVRTTPTPTAAANVPQAKPSPVNRPQVAQTSQPSHDNSEPKQNASNQSRNSADRSADNDPPPAGRRDRIAANRDREDDNSRRDQTLRRPNSQKPNPQSNSSDADADNDAQDREDSQQLGPKLIQWSGSVNREREVTIDLPGVPGTLEIPRVYRNRVGVVEPPSGSNRWRCAKLRVFGQGGVSFVVRWWPTVRNFAHLNAQK